MPSKKAQAQPQQANDFKSYEAWAERFARVAGQFKWYLLEGAKVRTKIDGVTCCPMIAYGYTRTGGQAQDRHVPDTRDMASAAGVHDSVAAAVVHVADGLCTSRYWSKDKRRQLLKTCKLPDDDASEDAAVLLD